MRITIITKGKHKGHAQTPEYVPRGPVRIAKPEKPTRPAQDLDVRLQPERVSGWLYDAHSGGLIGIASDEMKASHVAGQVYTRTVGGMVQKFVIHP